jgi:predicted metalloprotease
MAGQNPAYPPPGKGYAPAGPRPVQPGHDPYALPARHRPRRTPAGTVVLALGALASVFVISILVVAVFTQHHQGAAATDGRSAATVSRAVATDNKLYRTGPLTAVSCRVPHITTASGESMRRFMEVLTGCLDASWRRQFAKGGLRYGPPQRVFWSEPGRSPCGSYPQPGAAAFYCPADNAMYVGLRDIIDTAGNEPVSNYAVYARVIAHEYGHHVQEEAGILAYGHEEMDRRSTAARTEASRRIELQAQCFAGAFLGAERYTLPMTPRQYHAMMADVRGRGDENQPPAQRDHGSSRHYAGWVEKGFRDRALSVCDTWSGAPSAVS